MQEQIIYKKISELKNNPNNPRKNDNAVDTVAKSIEKYGFRNPLIVDDAGVVWCGNTRLKAAKKLKLKEVPCIVVNDLTEQQMTELALLDNKTNEIAEWDTDMLSDILKSVDLSEFDLDWNVDLDIDDIGKEPEEDDFDVDENIPEQPKSKLGDIYQLGNHRLMCGDSTKKEDVNLLMNGEKADLVFTDPPYGMKKEKDGVANDNLNYDDLLEFNKQWIPLTFDLLKDNGSWYCWGIDEPLMDIYSHILKPMIKNKQIAFRNLITWDKGNGQGQLSADFRMYPIADEKCLFVMCGKQNYYDEYLEIWEPIRKYMIGEKTKAGLKTCKEINKIIGSSQKGGGMANHYFGEKVGQFSLPTEDMYLKLQKYCSDNSIKAFEKEYEEIKKEYEEIKKEYEEIKQEFYKNRAYFDNTYDNMNNVWHFSKTSGEERESAGGHATPKPIALCSRAIKASSRENEIVLDVFGGSGSTLIACEQLNRICYCNELEPHWCDVIINRWEKLTGQKAIKIN